MVVVHEAKSPTFSGERRRRTDYFKYVSKGPECIIGRQTIAVGWQVFVKGILPKNMQGI